MVGMAVAFVFHSKVVDLEWEDNWLSYMIPEAWSELALVVPYFAESLV